MLSRTMHGIAYDSVADRIIVPAQFSQAILSFRGDATGEELPVRVIQGPRTQIRRADRVTVDPFRKEIFVSDGGQILVFPADANGDVAPIRALRGPDTLIADAGRRPGCRRSVQRHADRLDAPSAPDVRHHRQRQRQAETRRGRPRHRRRHVCGCLQRPGVLAHEHQLHWRLERHRQRPRTPALQDRPGRASSRPVA